MDSIKAQSLTEGTGWGGEILLFDHWPEYHGFCFDYRNVIFEWDEEKEKTNFLKHGIRFKTAAKVFADKDKLIRYDAEHSTIDDIRFDVIGKVGKTMFVVCAFQDENVVRIISARLAGKPEKERYEYGCTYEK